MNGKNEFHLVAPTRNVSIRESHDFNKTTFLLSMRLGASSKATENVRQKLLFEVTAR